nr:hypothetical protein [uncultured Mucilaginibacter sp.]
MRILLLIFLSAACISADAQKLPNVQSVGKLLPENAKIDGKLTEWQDVLQAYNKTTRIEYTLADNAGQFYLAVRSKDVASTAKILAGGITLNINIPGVKQANAPSITVPVTNSGYALTPSGDVKANFSVLTDSLKIVAAIKQFKFIKALNFKGLQDTLLSIYNEQGIQSKMTYDNGTFVCEILIPKQFIGLAGLSKSFTYQIKLNGVPSPPIAGGPPPAPLTAPPNWLPSDPRHINLEVRTPTYLRGEYTLAK